MPQMTQAIVASYFIYSLCKMCFYCFYDFVCCVLSARGVLFCVIRAFLCATW
jgi:hypothetical protein